MKRSYAVSVDDQDEPTTTGLRRAVKRLHTENWDETATQQHVHGHANLVQLDCWQGATHSGLVSPYLHTASSGMDAPQEAQAHCVSHAALNRTCSNPIDTPWPTSASCIPSTSLPHAPTLAHSRSSEFSPHEHAAEIQGKLEGDLPGPLCALHAEILQYTDMNMLLKGLHFERLHRQSSSC
mmetsp:Transcript_30829/g.59509  ORF Transcript_30829/g.59509 Transcript_30829/m.59509 type:complete len:181 (-) Transcript_30829:537-1079(-)|eukprot:CAMPEP_0114231072 /NCGR_PEP_ID=MMETSP0058-20121206/3826_1 /TAXON_ID=36894 /ORGANISM="Pyramimonas parkeae, CCMP726" /LENGTH=180 /DNA_ID=CAMNT_0001342351 /DNA_START=301 /DNA_END=843 /DNA_ORIENTATION=-